MMKWLALSAMTFAIPSLLIAKPVADLPKAQPPAQPYDADLFRKDVQVYSAHAELLVWAVSEGALDYAVQMQQPAAAAPTYYAQGNFASGTYDVDPGVRVALSYFRALHYWEIKWQYTRLTSRGHNTVNQPDGAYLTGTWPQIIPDPLAQATSYLHLNYNVFDWLIDRVFIPNPHLRLRTVGGLFAAWMDQFWKVRYIDTASASTTITNRWHYVGAGLKMGTVVDWYWTGDLYVTAAAHFGALIGSYSNFAKQTVSAPVMNSALYDTRGVFTTQMLFGPSWQKNFKNNRIEVFTGFEANLWFNLQEIYRSTGSADIAAAKETRMSTGMLALYGLTTRLTVDF